MAFRFFGSGRKKATDRAPDLETSETAEPSGPVGVRDQERPEVDRLYQAVSARLALYMVDDSDVTARSQPVPGGLLPELMPGLFNALRQEVVPDQVDALLIRMADNSAVDPAAEVPGLIGEAGAVLRDLSEAKLDGDTKAHRKLEQVRRLVNEDTEFLSVREQRFSAGELDVLAALLSADADIRTVVEEMRVKLNPRIIDFHEEEEGDWFELWDRALIDLKRHLKQMDEKIEAEELPRRALVLVFITLMNRRVIRPGQLILLLKAHLLHMDAALFEGTEYAMVVENLLVKLNDHVTAIHGMLMGELRTGVRLTHMEDFIEDFREFHSIYYAMLEDLALADHPKHGKMLERLYSQVLDGILEKLMPAVGTLAFDLLPDPHAGASKGGVRKKQATTGLEEREKIPKDADSDVKILVPFFRCLREAARDCGMDKPAREVERGLITGLQFRLKAFVTDLQDYLEGEQGDDFSVMTRTLMNMDEIYTALATLEFESTLQNARSLIRTSVKLSVKAGTRELAERKADPEALKAFLDDRHAAMARLIARLVAEHLGDLEENGRFNDPGMLQVLDEVHAVLTECYGPLGEAMGTSLVSGKTGHAEKILMVCDDLADAFDCEADGRLAEISDRQPKLVREMLERSVEELMTDVTASTGREMKIKLLGAAEAVKRLHDYFSRKGDKDMAGLLLKKLQIALVAAQTGRPAARA